MRRQVYRKYSSDADPLDNPSGGFETTGAPLCPNKADIGSADSCTSTGLTNAMEADMSRTELAAIWPPTASAAREAGHEPMPPLATIRTKLAWKGHAVYLYSRAAIVAQRRNERRDPVLTNL